MTCYCIPIPIIPTVLTCGSLLEVPIGVPELRQNLVWHAGRLRREVALAVAVVRFLAFAEESGRSHEAYLAPRVMIANGPLLVTLSLSRLH